MTPPGALSYRVLEPRMVFDAALAATAGEAAKHTEPAHAPDTAEASARADASHAALVEVLQAQAPSAPANPVDAMAVTIVPLPTCDGATGAAADGSVIKCVLPKTVDPAATASGFSAPAATPGDAETSSVPAAPLDKTATLDMAAAPQASAPPAPASVVFVDPRVENYQQIVAHVAAGSQIVVLDAHADGLDQIASYLSSHTGVASIHILSHGASGAVELGGSVITNGNLADHQADLAAIGAALKPGGDILIYGCNVASGAAGDQFIHTIAQLTGDDVAASTDETGAAVLGGNWLLEASTGKIEAQSIEATDWQGLLTVNVATGGTAAALAANITSSTSTSNSGLVVKSGTEVLTTSAATNWYGQLTTSNSNLGIANGVVLGTGDVSQISGVPSTFWTGAGSGASATVAGVNEFDIANLQFQFTANVNKIVVTYVFGSEEYNDYVGSAFNDRFYIDLTGANPAGGNYSATHVSKVPGTTTDVAINSVNNGPSAGAPGTDGAGTGVGAVNPAWFRDNKVASAPVGDVVLDGLTKPISNVIDVVKGSTYTINFNIADIGDSGFNSAVFIDALVASLQINLDANKSSGATGNNYQTTFTEKGAAVAIADTDTTVTNYDPYTQIQSATVTLTNAQSGDALNVGTLPAGISATLDSTSVPGEIIVHLNGASTTANYQLAIEAISFANSSNSPSVADRIVTVVANDGETDSNTATSTIHVNPVNDAPVLAAPASQTTLEDTAIVFSAANGNAITISDVDAGSAGLETVTLSVANGTLKLGSTAGLASFSGDGTGTVKLTGTLAQVNAAVAGLTYRNTADYNGSDALTISITDDGRDNGNATTNGILSAGPIVVPITITPMADITNDTVGTLEDAALTFNAITGTNGATADSFENADAVVTAVTQGAHGSVTFLADGTLKYTPNTNTNGADSFTYTVTSGGVSETATITVNVTPVNDAPAGADNTVTTLEDTPYAFKAADFGFTDPNDSPANTLLAVKITTLPVSGTLTDNGVAVTAGQFIPVADITGGKLVFTPAANANGTTTGLTFQVQDDGGTANGGANLDPTPNAITFNVTPVNDAPVAAADYNSTKPQVAIVTDANHGVLANDTDVDTAHSLLVVSSVSNATSSVGPGTVIAGSTGGVFTINADGSYSFDPGHAFDSLQAGTSETTSVTYQVSDGQGGFAINTLTITIPYQNLPPYVAQPLPAQSGNDGDPVSIPLGGVFADPNPADQGHLTITASGLPPGLGIDASGNLTGTLTSDASQHAGAYQVTLTATDPAGNQVSTTFAFAVSNPSPLPQDDVNTAFEHIATTGKVLTNDLDGGLDHDVLTVSQINGQAFTAGSVITLKSGAQLVMAADGTYSYDPHGAFNGLGVNQTAADSFTYQVSDGQGGYATATVDITIQGQNDNPIVVDPTTGTPPADPNHIVPVQGGQDGSAITPFSVKTYFKDPDTTDKLTLSITGTLPSGVMFDPTTGIFSGTPASDASQGGPAHNGVYTVLVNADDSHNGVTSTAVTFTIKDPVPVAVSDSGTVAEHGTLVVTDPKLGVLGNDQDGGKDTDPLTVNEVNGQTLVPGATITLPSGAHLVMAADGTYSYDPNKAFASLMVGQTATDSFTYQVSDGQGGYAGATVNITITGQNDAPVGNADANTTQPQVAVLADAAHGVLVNDTDAEHDSLQVTGVTNGTTSAGPGTAISGTNGGTFTINPDGSYAFDPGHAFDGLAPGTTASTSITYTVDDGHGGTSQSTLTITVPYTNLPPIVQAPVPTQNASDGDPVSIPVVGVFTDPNPGDTLTISATGLPPGLAYNPATGAIEGTLAHDASQHNGMPYTVTLTATDPSGSSVTSTFTYNVANPVPVAADDTSSVTEHGTLAVTDPKLGLLANDHDGGADTDPLSISQVDGKSYTPGSTINLKSGALLTVGTDGTYSYDPHGVFDGLSVDQTATDTFTYRVSDGQGGFADATVTITIHGQNEAPVVVDPNHPGTTPTDPNHVVPVVNGADGSSIAPLDVTPYFADADKADTLIFSVPNGSLPPGLAFDPAKGTFSGTFDPSASQGGNAGPGIYAVVVTAVDGHGGSTQTTVTFKVTNPAPVGADDANTVAEHGTLDVTDSKLGVLANDTDGGTDSDLLSVSDINGSPAAVGHQIALPSSALLTMHADGTYSYDPNGAFAYLQGGQSTTDTFTYQVSDGQGGYADATVKITISGQNDAPIANADTNSVAADGSLIVLSSLGVLGNDTDAEHDTLTVTRVTNAATSVGAGAIITGSNGGVFTINGDGTYTFDTAHAFDSLPPGTTAQTSVTYTVDDGHGGTSESTLTITIPYTNLPPFVKQPVPTQNAMDGDPVTIPLAGVFSDPNPGDTLTIAVTGGLPPGLTFDPATNAITGALAADASQHTGPYTVTLSATDPSGSIVTSTFTFNVGNPPPVAGNDTGTVTEHGVLTVTDPLLGVLANDHDGGADTDTLAITKVDGNDYTPGTAVTLPSGAELKLYGDGTYSYDPHGTFNGLALGEKAVESFTYLITDGQGGTSLATVSITITGENEPPVVVEPVHPGTTPADPSRVVPVEHGLDGAPITPLKVTPYFADADTSDTLTLSADPAALPPGLSFDPKTGTFSGTLDHSASQGGNAGPGVYDVTVTASDGHPGGTTTTVVRFVVTNPAPLADADTGTVSEHGKLIVTDPAKGVLGNDTDDDQIQLVVSQVDGKAYAPGAAITLKSGALLVMNADGTYSYDPNGKFNGLGVGQTATESFTYQVDDGQGGHATATVTVIIQGENDTPYLVDPTHPGTPVPPGQTVIPVQPAQDGTPLTPIDVTSYFKDPDVGDKLTLSVDPKSLPPGVTFDAATGKFSGTPTADASQGGNKGSYPVVITASDGNGGSIQTTLTIVVTNPPPVASDDAGTVSEHGTLAVTDPKLGVLANDHDGGKDTDTLSVTMVNGSPSDVGHQITLPSGALLTLLADGTYSYDPNGVFLNLSAGESGTDSFTYQVSDSNGATATATVKITIGGQNDPPVVVDPNHPGQPPADPDHVVGTVKGSDGAAIAPFSVSNVFHDPDHSDVLTYSVDPAALPPGLAFDPKTGTFSGTPGSNASQGGPGHDGTYPVQITASDGHGGTVSTIVTFIFANVPPVAADDSSHTEPGQPVTLDVLANDHDGGGDRDLLTIVSASTDSGAVSINPSGTLKFMPADGFNGIATITYTISDGQGGFSTATAKVLVTPNIHVQAPKPDTATSPNGTPPEGLAAQGAVLAAVRGSDDLGTVSTSFPIGIKATGIVDATANEVSGLGGLVHTGDTTGRSNGWIDLRENNPVWRLQSLITGQFGRPGDTWNPDGLTGFSLRYTFAADPQSRERAQIVLDSIVRDRTLIVNLTSTRIEGHASVVEYRVMQADGRPLPGWLDRAGGNVLIGERPVDVEEIELRVVAIMSDGTTIERDVVIQTNSGEIQPLKESKRSDAIPLFSDQVRAFAGREQTEFDRLLQALAG